MAEGARDEAGNTELRGASAVVAQGRYRLFASLGRGGMADVYLGVAQGPMGFNKLVVVKKLREGLIEDESFVSMFLDEGRLAARLNHPNVIHTYEIGEYEKTYFLAMEYLDGQSLSSISKALVLSSDKKVEPTIWAKIIADALSGLHHAHELKDYDGTSMQVIHRDVSPQNLFITYDGRVKLVDFGIAKAALNSSQTETGVLKGKIAYMAPEQAMGQTIDRRADIFPMGIVLWELLAGRRLITGDAAAALHKLLNEPIRPLTEVIPDFDPALNAIVMKALEKDPTNRYQTAAEMRAALEAYLRTKDVAITEEQIGALVTDLFKARRAEVQKQIQTYMSNAAADGSMTTINTLTFTTGSLPSLTSGSKSSGSHSTGRTRTADESDVSAVKPAIDGRSKRGIMTAVTALAVLGAIGAWVATRGHEQPHAQATQAPAPQRVTITIVAAPPQSALYLDDVKLAGNPYVGSFPRDEKEHQLRAEASGFVPSTRGIRLQTDATYEFALASVPAPPVATAPPEKPKPAIAAPQPRTPPKTPPTGKTPAAVPTLEQDPWK
jgi:serine/threonine protein kinase